MPTVTASSRTGWADLWWRTQIAAAQYEDDRGNADLHHPEPVKQDRPQHDVRSPCDQEIDRDFIVEGMGQDAAPHAAAQLKKQESGDDRARDAAGEEDDLLGEKLDPSVGSARRQRHNFARKMPRSPE